VATGEMVARGRRRRVGLDPLGDERGDPKRSKSMLPLGDIILTANSKLQVCGEVVPQDNMAAASVFLIRIIICVC
jgi:hypothetical protein